MSKTFFIVFLTFVTLIGEIGQVIWLPLWLDATVNSTTSPASHVMNNKASGSYGVLMIACFSEAFIFLILFLFFGNPSQYTVGRYFIIASVLNLISSLFTPFLSSSYRNNPSLQAILLNCAVPATVLFRLFWLKRFPSIKKLFCVILVVIGLVICLIPDFLHFRDTPTTLEGPKESPYVHVHRILWTLLFILLSVVPSTFSIVFLEKIFKEGDVKIFSRKSTSEESECLISKHPGFSSSHIPPPDMFYFVLFMNVFQLLGACAFFWIDLIPNLGYSSSIKDFSASLKHTFLCSGAQNGCKFETFGFCLGYILSIVTAQIAGIFLIKYGEGCIFLALILNLVTPAAITFWMLFDSNPLRWYPHFDPNNIYTLISIIIIIPAVIIYSRGHTEYSISVKRSSKSLFGCAIPTFSVNNIKHPKN